MNFEKKYGTYDIKTISKWFEQDGAKFLIAPNLNNVHRQEMFKLHALGDNATMHEQMTMASATTAKALLLDWDGVEDADGNALPYSEETASEILLKYPDFLTWVSKCAQELSEEREAAVDDTVKN